MIFLVAVCSYGFAKFKEPVPLFEAVSAIKIDISTNMASILTGEYWMQSENMDTHAYIIKSFPVLSNAAKSLGWIPRDLKDEVIRDNKKYVAIIERLKLMVEAEHQEGTNIIDIKVVSDDAVEATRIANAFARSYREYNIREKNKKTSPLTPLISVIDVTPNYFATITLISERFIDLYVWQATVSFFLTIGDI